MPTGSSAISWTGGRKSGDEDVRGTWLAISDLTDCWMNLFGPLPCWTGRIVVGVLAARDRLRKWWNHRQCWVPSWLLRLIFEALRGTSGILRLADAGWQYVPVAGAATARSAGSRAFVLGQVGEVNARRTCVDERLELVPRRAPDPEVYMEYI